MNLKPDPLGVPRNPLAVFLLCLTFVSGGVTVAGEAAAQSIEAMLPPAFVAFWGTMLVFGSGITLVGMYWQGTVAFGLLCKRIGMFSLTVASAVYALVVLIAFGWGGLFAGSVVIGFGTACAVQYRNLNRRVRYIIAATSRGGDREQ